MLTITDAARERLGHIQEENPGKTLRVVLSGFG